MGEPNTPDEGGSGLERQDLETEALEMILSNPLKEDKLRRERMVPRLIGQPRKEIKIIWVLKRNGDTVRVSSGKKIGDKPGYWKDEDWTLEKFQEEARKGFSIEHMSTEHYTDDPYNKLPDKIRAHFSGRLMFMIPEKSS